MVNIMVDIDGVLVDWLGKFRRLYNKKVGLNNAEIMSTEPNDREFLYTMHTLVDYNVKDPINGLDLGIVKEVLEEIDEVKGEVNEKLAHFLVNLNKDPNINVEVVTARTRHLDATYKLMVDLGFDEGHIILGMKHKEDLHIKYDIIIDDSPYLVKNLSRVSLPWIETERPTIAQEKIFMPSWSYNWHQRHLVRAYGSTTQLIMELTELVNKMTKGAMD